MESFVMQVHNEIDKIQNKEVEDKKKEQATIQSLKETNNGLVHMLA